METHYVYTDISHRNGVTRGAFVVDNGRPQSRILPARMTGHEAELALIIMIVQELPRKNLYVICNDTTTLQFMGCRKKCELFPSVQMLKGLLRDRNVMLLHLPPGNRPRQYIKCHHAARRAADQKTLSERISCTVNAPRMRVTPLSSHRFVRCTIAGCVNEALWKLQSGEDSRVFCTSCLPKRLRGKAS